MATKKYKLQKAVETKKKTETKKVAMWVIVSFGILWVNLSYLLAWFDKSTNDMTTATVITSILGVFVTYAFTSYKEKDSRNKYNVDEYGHPYDNTPEQPIQYNSTPTEYPDEGSDA